MLVARWTFSLFALGFFDALRLIIFMTNFYDAWIKFKTDFYFSMRQILFKFVKNQWRFYFFLTMYARSCLKSVIDIFALCCFIQKRTKKIGKHLINRAVGIFKWIVKFLCLYLDVNIMYIHTTHIIRFFFLLSRRQ